MFSDIFLVCTVDGDYELRSNFILQSSYTGIWTERLNSDIVISISTISTKQTTISYLKSLSTKKTTTYGIANLGVGLGQVQTCGRVKQVNGIPTLSFW
jgi:hypothetical protein